MNILTLSPEPVYPWRRGLEHRIYHFLKPLCGKHQISQLSFSPSTPMMPEELAHAKELFHIVTMVDSSDLADIAKRGYIGRIKEWFAPTSVNFGGVSTSSAMKDKLADLLANNQFDLIYVASPYMLNYVLDSTGPPVLFEAIDDSSLLSKREIALRNGYFSKLKAIKDWLVVRQAEKKFYSRFREIVLTSPVDAEAMRKLCPNSNITVIPNGVDAHSYDQHYQPTERPSLVFTGVMNYGPNDMAMKFFCQSVLPIIEKQIPDIELAIAGRDPSNEIIALGQNSERIIVTGAVDDIKPYISSAWVYVCPLISGAGIKNKVLEAWAAETPIVATSLSCDGIDVAPGEDILVADSAEDFAAAVIKLITDKDLATRLAKAGRKRVLASYDWESKSKRLEELFEKTAGA